MDSRDIKEPTPVIEDGKYLEKIFELQTALLNHYIEIEGLPNHPIDVNSKKNQIILKDFTGRVIEELGEGYESMLKIYNVRLDHLKTVMNGLENPENTEAYRLIKSEVQNMNEEFADALHFMMELLIYANIYPEDLYSYCNKVSSKHKGVYGLSINNLSRAMDFSKNLVKPIFDDQATTLDLKVGSEPDECTPIGWETGGKVIEKSAYNLWDITYSLSISRNCLKNKPWKQSGELTDENLYQTMLCESFVKLIGFYASMGYTDKSLFAVYFKKNCVNNFRIMSKY